MKSSRHRRAAAEVSQPAISPVCPPTAHNPPVLSRQSHRSAPPPASGPSETARFLPTRQIKLITANLPRETGEQQSWSPSPHLTANIYLIIPTKLLKQLGYHISGFSKGLSQRAENALFGREKRQNQRHDIPCVSSTESPHGIIGAQLTGQPPNPINLLLSHSGACDTPPIISTYTITNWLLIG